MTPMSLRLHVAIYIFPFHVLGSGSFNIILAVAVAIPLVILGIILFRAIGRLEL